MYKRQHDDLSRVVEKVKNACDRLSAKGTEPTEFEAITAAAMLTFMSKSATRSCLKWVSAEDMTAPVS